MRSAMGRHAVELALECGDKQARVIVRDAGSGIPEDQMEKVFRPFYRLEGRGRRPRGDRAGLAIVRQLAERMAASDAEKS